MTTDKEKWRKLADEIQARFAKCEDGEDSERVWPDDGAAWAQALRSACDALDLADARAAVLREALHWYAGSMPGSQYDMSGLGNKARAVLANPDLAAEQLLKRIERADVLLNASLGHLEHDYRCPRHGFGRGECNCGAAAVAQRIVEWRKSN